MAKVIEFYVPSHFEPKSKWVPEEERGKFLTFPAPNLPDAIAKMVQCAVESFTVCSIER